MRVLLGEPGGRASLLGTLKERLSEAVETSVFLDRASLGEYEGNAPSSGTSTEG
jgi:hypothetical protein